jgi:hypothetical protein
MGGWIYSALHLTSVLPPNHTGRIFLVWSIIQYEHIRTMMVS